MPKWFDKHWNDKPLVINAINKGMFKLRNNLLLSVVCCSNNQCLEVLGGFIVLIAVNLLRYYFVSCNVMLTNCDVK